MVLQSTLETMKNAQSKRQRAYLYTIRKPSMKAFSLFPNLQNSEKKPNEVKILMFPSLNLTPLLFWRKLLS